MMAVAITLFPRNMGGDRMTPVEEFRARIAVRMFPLYLVAAEVGLHPSRLGSMLRERTPMPPAVSERLRDVLDRMDSLERSGR
jgi:hypothetical protein